MAGDAGYITLACGSEKYLQMAINLALSIKLNDPGRPICLVHDDAVRPDEGLRKIFDDFALLPPAEGFVGCMNKIRLYPMSPYRKTMYVDSDCLIVKPDMDRHWARFDGSYFNLAGAMRTEGNWYQFDIAEVCKALNVPYIVQMNSGVYYFERGEAAERLFADTNRLFREKRDLIGRIHQGRANQYADEPFFGVAMGEHRIKPLSYRPEEGSIMVTTVWSRKCEFDPIAHVSRMEKASGYIIPKLWARSWVRHSPSVAHFVALKPRAVYAAASDALRRRFSIPLYSF